MAVRMLNLKLLLINRPELVQHANVTYYSYNRLFTPLLQNGFDLKIGV